MLKSQHGSETSSLSLVPTVKQLLANLVKLKKDNSGVITNQVEWSTKLNELKSQYPIIGDMLDQDTHNIAYPPDKLAEAHTVVRAREQYPITSSGQSLAEQLQAKADRYLLKANNVLHTSTDPVIAGSKHQQLYIDPVSILPADEATADLIGFSREGMDQSGKSIQVDIDFFTQNIPRYRYTTIVVDEFPWIQENTGVIVNAKTRTSPESLVRRTYRERLWSALKDTAKNAIDEVAWSHIEYGNTKGLYTFIAQHSRADDRFTIVNKIMNDLFSITKGAETYNTFTSRFNTILTRAHEQKLDIDRDILTYQAMRATRDCLKSDTYTLRAFTQVLGEFMALPSGTKTYELFFRKVQSYMTEYERKPLKLKEKKFLTSEEKDKRIEVLEKQIKSFNARTKRNTPKQVGQYKEGIPEDKKITSKSRICFDQLQHGMCKRENCTYNHTPLTDDQREQAKSLLEEMKGTKTSDK